MANFIAADAVVTDAGIKAPQRQNPYGF